MSLENQLMQKGTISHEEAAQAQERSNAEARQKVKYWEDVIRDYGSKLLERQTAQADANGMIVEGKTGAMVSKNEAVGGMRRLIQEAEAEKAKEEAKIK